MRRSSVGSRNQHIEIQQPTITKDTQGGKVTKWEKFTAAFASKNNLSGSERSATAHGGQVAVARTVFEMYYQPDITESMRVVHNGKYYNIKHVNNVFEENKDLILTCETGANDG